MKDVAAGYGAFELIDELSLSQIDQDGRARLPGLWCYYGAGFHVIFVDCMRRSLRLLRSVIEQEVELYGGRNRGK
jgi:hypothetical protein